GGGGASRARRTRVVPRMARSIARKKVFTFIENPPATSTPRPWARIAPRARMVPARSAESQSIRGVLARHRALRQRRDRLRRPPAPPARHGGRLAERATEPRPALL